MGDQRRCDGGAVGNDGWGEEEREERVCVRERETDRQTETERRKKEIIENKKENIVIAREHVE